MKWRFMSSTSGLQGPACTHGPLPRREGCPPRLGGSRGPACPRPQKGNSSAHAAPWWQRLSLLAILCAARRLFPFLWGHQFYQARSLPPPINHLLNGPPSKCSHTEVHPGLQHVNLGGAELRPELAARSCDRQHHHRHKTEARKPSSGSQNTHLRPSQGTAAGTRRGG